MATTYIELLIDKIEHLNSRTMYFEHENIPKEIYEFLEKEPFETEYGVTGLARDRQKAYRSTYVKYNYIGACTCVLSPVPLLA